MGERVEPLLVELDALPGKALLDIVRKSMPFMPTADSFATEVSTYLKGTDSRKTPK